MKILRSLSALVVFELRDPRLEQLQAPITQLFQAVAQRVMQLSQPGAATGPDAYRQLMPMMEALRTIARIFYSLNYHDLPEYFEDHMGEVRSSPTPPYTCVSFQ